MEQQLAEVSIKGVIHRVPCAVTDQHTIISEGRWLKTASIHDEHWRPATVDNPESLVSGLRQQGLAADIFTFSQKLPETTPRFTCRME
jgi:hypothetical protein